MESLWYVRRVRLNNGGYDSAGSYYGNGEPLFECFSDDESTMIRGYCRQSAIDQLMISPEWRRSESPKLARVESDRTMPRHDMRGARMFYTKRGFLTDYALSCGYVEIRGDSESCCRMEKLSSGVYRVYGGGRWIRGEGESFYHSLAAARRAFMAFDHRTLTRTIAARHGIEESR